MPIVIAVIAIFIILIAGCIFVNEYNKHIRKFVEANSVALKELDQLNKEFRFFDMSAFSYYHRYDNMRLFEQISCQDFLIYNLQLEQQKILLGMKQADKNKIEYDKYAKKLQDIAKFGNFKEPLGGFKLKKLIIIEKELFDKRVLCPATKFELLVRLEYKAYNKKVCFDKDSINCLIKRINNKRGTYFCDKEIWEAICRVERGWVSNQLRFSIYERDGYRCVNCGASDRETDLEIDHIIPISKGGKSDYNNLQTLCRRCNKAKGNQIY